MKSVEKQYENTVCQECTSGGQGCDLKVMRLAIKWRLPTEHIMSSIESGQVWTEGRTVKAETMRSS